MSDKIETFVWEFNVTFACLFLLLSMVYGCEPVPGMPDYGTAEQESIGTVGDDPNPLTFWWYATADTHQDRIRQALECGLDRWNRAACLGLDVSFNAHHWTRFKDLGGPGKANTSGSWSSVRIYHDLQNNPIYDCPFMVHEICHLLRLSNAHVGEQCNSPTSSTAVITDADLNAVCAVRDCGCYTPE